METDLENKFGTRLKELRIDAGLSQADVAKRVGASPLTVMRWENGFSRPQFKFQKELADLFDITIVYLMRGMELVHDKNAEKEEYA